MIVVAAVRRVTGGASLHKGGLMVHRLLAQVVEVAVTSQADGDRIGLRQSRLVAGVRAMAIGAIARRAGMWHFGRLDQLGLVVMAGYAQGLGVGLRQHYFSVFCRRVAGVAAIHRERCMHELIHQLGKRRLVRIMTLQTVGRGEGLVLMSFLQVCVLCIMAVQTERRGRLGQMEPVLCRRFGARLVGEVAGVTAHIESGMTAALLGHIQSRLVATEAEVFLIAA